MPPSAVSAGSRASKIVAGRVWGSLESPCRMPIMENGTCHLAQAVSTGHHEVPDTQRGMTSCSCWFPGIPALSPAFLCNARQTARQNVESSQRTTIIGQTPRPASLHKCIVQAEEPPTSKSNGTITRAQTADLLLLREALLDALRRLHPRVPLSALRCDQLPRRGESTWRILRCGFI